MNLGAVRGDPILTRDNSRYLGEKGGSMSRWWIWLVVVFLVIGLLFLNRAHFGVIVLHYHAINDRTGKEEIIAVRPEDFAWHMEYLKKAG